MSTLLERANQLTALAGVIEDAAGAGHALAALAEVEQQIQATNEKLDRALTLLSYLPKIDTIDAARVETVVSGCDKVAERLKLNPSTLKAGKTWAKLHSSSSALVRDLRSLSSARWRKLVDSVPTAEIQAFLETLAPGASGRNELKHHLLTLEECRHLETPSPADVAKARLAIDGITQGKQDLKVHVVPEGVREKYARLVQGVLPLSDFHGEVAEFVESQGISKRLRVGLDLEGDG